MRTLVIILLLILNPQISFGQTNIYSNQINQVEIDNLQHLYISAGNQITKYKLSGEELFQYSNALFGNISSIDVTNPLRILVFYRESNTIVFLNQQLAEISDPIDMDNTDNSQAYLACSSSRGGFWIYDDIEQVIIHFNANLTETTRTQNISSITQNTETLLLQEQNNIIYLSYKANETLVFDQFATYLSKIPQAIQSKIYVQKNMISFWNGTSWCIFHELTKDIVYQKGFPIKGSTKVIHFNSKQIYQFKNRVEIYSNE